jgi:hypothetical protein
VELVSDGLADSVSTRHLPICDQVYAFNAAQRMRAQQNSLTPAWVTRVGLSLDGPTRRGRRDIFTDESPSAFYDQH